MEYNNLNVVYYQFLFLDDIVFCVFYYITLIMFTIVKLTNGN